jgi:hypothetical protein
VTCGRCYTSIPSFKQRRTAVSRDDTSSFYLDIPVNRCIICAHSAAAAHVYARRAVVPGLSREPIEKPGGVRPTAALVGSRFSGSGKRKELRYWQGCRFSCWCCARTRRERKDCSEPSAVW